MLERIREKLLRFIESEKDVPLLAGFSIGIYMLLYYYSKSFAHSNSWQQLSAYTAYYIILPMLGFYIAYRIFSIQKLRRYRKQIFFIGMITLFCYLFLQITAISFSRKLTYATVLVLAVVLSFKLGRYYKALIVLLLVMAVFNTSPLIGAAYKCIANNDDWRKLPDDIQNVKFASKPNVYYIQPDGYTNFDNFKHNRFYKYDNSAYISFLQKNGFTMYDEYRSNYYSTLLSNAATFSMMHHYIQEDVEVVRAGGIVMDNPVLEIFKDNGYKTSFITESPYLISNRPKIAYDFCNINYDELPIFGDGLGQDKDVFGDLQKQMKLNGESGNFYFIEKFSPSHINTFAVHSKGSAAETGMHMEKLKEATIFLEKTISHIVKADPDALIIIGADHGGFSGFDYGLQSERRTTDEDLIKSIFGAQLAIKWNNPAANEYDKGLKTGINLFRTLFSFLAEDKKYLERLQENSSYIRLKKPEGVYRYFDNSGKIVFEKR